METWKDVPSTGGRYQASSLGRVRNAQTGRVMKGSPNHAGYVKLTLRLDGSNKHVLAHRLVAEAFFGPAFEYAEVNHKDLNKTHNAPENLEYVTPQGNSEHYWAAKRAAGWAPKDNVPRYGKPIEAVSVVGGAVMKFNNRNEAVAAGFTAAGISQCLTGRVKAHRGWTFKEAA
jgi:hypothetical protein